MNIPFLTAVALGASLLSLIAVIYVLWQIHSLNRLKSTFFAGRQGADLEEVINGLADHIRQLREQQEILEQSLLVLKNNFNLSVQKVGVVRFNPFADGGGNLSFSIAMLDGHDTGLVITSMHGREQNRIYTKKINKGTTEVALTEEEKQAVHEARTQHRAQVF